VSINGIAEQTALLSRRSVRCLDALVPDQSKGCQQSSRQPYPEKFTLNDRKTAIREEVPETYWRHSYGPPWQEITFVIEGRKKGDSKTAVRHRIKQAMAGCDDEKVSP